MEGVPGMSVIHKLYARALPRALRSYHRYIIFVAILFITCMVVGFKGYRPSPDGSLPWALRGLAELSDKLASGPLWKRLLTLLWNNMRVTLVSLALGWLLGIVPIISTCLNGVVIGMAVKMVMVRSGWSMGMVSLSFLPHGVFEIPAFLVGQAIGVRIGFLTPLAWRGKATSKDLGRMAAESLTLLAAAIVPLLALAALLELTLTPAVIRWTSPSWPPFMP